MGVRGLLLYERSWNLSQMDKLRQLINTSMVLRDQIRERNEQKWQAFPGYIDYLFANHYFERPTAVSLDIDGYIHLFPLFNISLFLFY